MEAGIEGTMDAKFMGLLVLAVALSGVCRGDGLTEIVNRLGEGRLLSDAVKDFPARDGSEWLEGHLGEARVEDVKPGPGFARQKSTIGMVVALTRVGGSWVLHSHASCFAIKHTENTNLVVTCAHLLPARGTTDFFLIGVVNHKGEIGLVSRCLVLDEKSDFAVFEVEKVFAESLELTTEKPEMGDNIAAFGSHPKFGFLRLGGQVIGAMRNGCLLSDVRAVSGLSGSPCFLDDGRVFGWIQEILPSLRPARVSGDDLFSEASFTAIRLTPSQKILSGADTE